MQRVGKKTLRTGGAGRSLLILVVLFAFSLQSFLIQTHIHNLPQSFQSVAGVSVSAPDSTKAPIDVDKCFLCQEFVHGGAYVAPAAAAVLPPNAVVSLLPLRQAPFLAAFPQSHNWMGRAPPRA